MAVTPMSKEEQAQQQAFRQALNNLQQNLAQNSEVLQTLLQYLDMVWQLNLAVPNTQLNLQVLAKREGIRETVALIRNLAHSKPRSPIVKPGGAK